MKHNVNWLLGMLKEFMTETLNKSLYEIVDIFECNKTGLTKAIIKLSERHMQKKNISDIILDDELIDNMDSRTVRTLTYMATLERLKPEYSIVVQRMNSEIYEYLLEIKSKNNSTTLQKSPSDLSRDKNLIAKFHPIEANKIGYMAGVRETVKEFGLIKKIH